jgi:hypothetical protein
MLTDKLKRSPEICGNIKGKRAKFKTLDIHLPNPIDVLIELHGDDVVQGEIIGLSDSGTQKDVYALIRVEGVQKMVIVPVDRIISLV